MSTYTDASLIVTPNAKKAGKLYSLKGADLDVVRATTATYVGSDGLIKTALANEVRFNYTNGSCPSILVEPQRTNLFLRSEEFDNAYWNKALGSTPIITQNSILSPSGTMTADTITPNNTLTNHWIGRTGFTLVSGTTYAFSVFAKNNGYNLVLSVGSSTVYTNCNFNLNNGTASTPLATSGANLCSPLIQNFGNGWYRCTIIFTAWTASNALLYSANNTTNTPSGSFGMAQITGDNVNGFFLWGAQLEAGANSTSYIPTVESTVTRNADVISKTGISDLIGQTEGTIFLDLYSPFDGTSKEISLSDGTLNNRIAIGYLNTANRFTLQVVKAGVSQVSNTFIPINQDITNKIILSYSLNNYRLFINGVLVFTDNVAEVFTNELSIFQLNRSIAQNPYFGRINSIQLYKTAFTDEQCIALTTL